MPRSTIELRQNAAQHYYFVMSSPKYGTAFTSSAFKTRDEAIAGIGALRSCAAFNNRYQRLVSARNEIYFALLAHNGQILGTSVMFSSDAEREKAIRAFKRQAPNAEILPTPSTPDATPPT